MLTTSLRLSVPMMPSHADRWGDLRRLEAAAPSLEAERCPRRLRWWWADRAHTAAGFTIRSTGSPDLTTAVHRRNRRRWRKFPAPLRVRHVRREPDWKVQEAVKDQVDPLNKRPFSRPSHKQPFSRPLHKRPFSRPLHKRPFSRPPHIFRKDTIKLKTTKCKKRSNTTLSIHVFLNHYFLLIKSQ